MSCKNRPKRCPKCGSFDIVHVPRISGGGLIGPWSLDECKKCRYWFNKKPIEDVDLLDYGPFHDERGNPIGR